MMNFQTSKFGKSQERKMHLWSLGCGEVEPPQKTFPGGTWERGKTRKTRKPGNEEQEKTRKMTNLRNKEC